jgi:putative lipoic acid-binding regulatory protein
VRHANGVDVWLIAHAIDDTEFRVFSITPSGVNTNPVRQRIGPSVNYGDVGYLKSSINGAYLAMACSVPKMLVLFSFDKAAGTISSPLVLDNNVAYGIEFSQRGRFLYSGSWDLSAIYQYDLSLPTTAIAAQRIKVGDAALASGALQMAPNGRIYIAHEDRTELSVIRQPEAYGTACDVRINSLDLGRVGKLGLPNFFPAVFTTEPRYRIEIANGCVGDTIPAALVSSTSVTNIVWDFGDPGSGTANRAVGARVTHVFSTARTFTVKVRFDNAGGQSTEVTTTVTIAPRPNVKAGPNVTVCAGSIVQLQATGASTYLWSPAELVSDSMAASPTALVTSTTTFIVTGTSTAGCVNEDTVVIIVDGSPVSVSSDTLICSGTSARLRASGTDTYEWSPATGLDDPRSASPLATPPTTTLYTVIGRTGTCADTATVVVAVEDPPVLTTSGDVNICIGASAVLWVSGANQVAWTPSTGLADPTADTITVSPTTTTTYTVQGWSEHGCTSSASITVTVGAGQRVNITADTLICLGDAAVLTCTNTGPVTWTDRTDGTTDQGSSITVQPTSSRWFIADIMEGGCAGRDSVFVNVVQPPTLTVTADTAVCAGSTITLTATSDGQILWDAHPDISDRTASVISVTPNGTTTYTVRASNAVCETSAQVTVTITAFETVDVISQQVSVVPDVPINITVRATNDATPFLPITSVIRVPTEVAEVTVLAAVGVTEVGRVTTGTMQEITILVEALPQQPSLFVLQVRPLLTPSSSVVEIVTIPTGCVNQDTVEIILTPEQCAGALRAVQIGADASFTIGVAPNPVTDVATISWSSAAIGEHILQIVSVVGEVVAEHRFTRTVTSPTAGSVMLDLSGYAGGGYTVVMLRPGDALSVQLSKAE